MYKRKKGAMRCIYTQLRTHTHIRVHSPNHRGFTIWIARSTSVTNSFARIRIQCTHTHTHTAQTGKQTNKQVHSVHLLSIELKCNVSISLIRCVCVCARACVSTPLIYGCFAHCFVRIMFHISYGLCGRPYFVSIFIIILFVDLIMFSRGWNRERERARSERWLNDLRCWLCSYKRCKRWWWLHSSWSAKQKTMCYF